MVIINNIKRNLYFFIVISVILIFIISFYSKKTEVNDITNLIKKNEISRHSVVLAGKTIKVDIADTTILRAQGLSGRASLLEDEGMLFVFDEVGNYSFWMKNMKFPIDIIWIDENFKIVYIKKYAQPETYPETFSPPIEKTSKYVLEVFSGFADQNNLLEGDFVLIN